MTRVLPLRRGRYSEPLLLALVVLAATAYAVFSLIRWSHLGAGGFDLGIFDQTVWRYSRFEAPENSVRGLGNIWGDHFSPILILLAPLYWVWEDARMLLLAQAVLLAAAAIPIFLYARERLGRWPAYAFAAAYLVFWGVQSAISFDFHELAFAPLLLAWLLLAAHRRSWRLYFALLVALLCVKEDQSIVAVFIGLYLLAARDWRPGLATIALGVTWYALVVGLLIPHFSPGGEFVYFNYSQFGEGPVSAAVHALTHPGLVVSTLFDDPAKRETLAYMFVPFLGLTFCSRAVILLAPLVAQRFLSDTPAYWTTGGQYTLAITAILFVGAADGLANLLRLAPRPRLSAGFAIAGAMAVLGLNVVYTVRHSVGVTELVTSEFHREPPGLQAALGALDAVPPDVSVATTDNVIVRLAHRDVAAEISAFTGRTDYVLANVVDPNANLAANGGFATVSGYVNAALATHDPVHYDDGWLVLRDGELPPLPRPAALEPLPPREAARLRAALAAWQARGSDARLTEALERVRPALSPGCAQLEYVASIGVALIAAARSDQAALARVEAVDASGAVARFAALCAP